MLNNSHRKGSGGGDEEEEKKDNPSPSLLKPHSELLKKGDRYMVLDLGGGTCDIVCHHMIGEYEVEEIRSPSGG